MTAKNVDWQNYRNWYNDRVMETYISAPIIDKQGDLIPTETLKEAMEFYMKYGIYAYKHDEIPIGVPLAYKIDDGKIKIKVGIHNKLEMHDKVWQEIKEFGKRGASSIRGEATDQRKICPDGESSCYTKIAKLGLWSVSWVGDNPANPDAKVDSVAMAKDNCCPDCGGTIEKTNAPTVKRLLNECKIIYKQAQMMSGSTNARNNTVGAKEIMRRVQYLRKHLIDIHDDYKMQNDPASRRN